MPKIWTIGECTCCKLGVGETGPCGGCKLLKREEVVVRASQAAD
jgi:hypothetical protein